MANNQQQMPSADDISITDNDTKQANARKRYAPGLYAFRVMDANNKVSDKKGSLMNVLKVAALKDPEDPKSVEKTTALSYVVLPLRNPQFKGHVVPKTAGMVASTFRALGVEFDDGTALRDYPRMNAEREFEFEGKVISKEEQKEKANEVTREVQDLALECWRNPHKYMNLVAWGKLSYEDGSDFPSIKFLAEMPEDETPVDPENFYAEDDGAETGSDEIVEEEEAPAPTPAKGKGKAPVKEKAAPASAKGKAKGKK